MQTRKIFPWLSLLCSIAIVALCAKSLVDFFLFSGSGNMSVTGTRCFIYFTVDSNILAALSCLIALPFSIKLIRGCAFPYWLTCFKFMGTVSVSVTFLTVIFFLGPIQGYGPMFAGNNLWLHLVCPLLAILSFSVFESGSRFDLRETLLGLIPTVVYGTVYLIMVVIVGAENGGWRDFYGFNMGGLWYVSLPAMLIGTYIISCVLYLIRKGFTKRENV